MNVNFLKTLSFAFLATFIISSCKKDPVLNDETLFEQEGVFFINEGTDNGSLSFIDVNDSLHKEVFQAVNDGAVIGKYVQSASLFDSKIFLVAGGSGKVEVVNQSDIKSLGTIENLANPRYLVAGSGSIAYLSQWGTTGTNGKIMIVDTEDYKVTDSIALGDGSIGPEMMVLSDSKLYVANSGGYGKDSNLVIINTSDKSVIKKIDVGGCPTQILKSADVIWVMAAGCYDATWTKGNGHIAKIEGDNATHVYEFPYGPLDNLTESVDGTKLFVTSTAGVYAFDIATGVFNPNPVIEGSFYGMDIDKDGERLYLSHNNTTSQNKIDIYSIDDNTLDLVRSVTGGLFTGEFYFQN